MSITMFLLLSNSIFSQDYVINSYQANSFPSSVKTVFIDLDTKAIIGEIIIGSQGAIINKKALPILSGPDTLYITATMEGCYCPNSIVDKNRVKFSIINPRTRNLIYSYADTNFLIDTFEAMPGNRVFIDGQFLSQRNRSIRGNFELDSGFHLSLREQQSPDFSYRIYPGIRSFINLLSAAPNKDLYRANRNTVDYILKTDQNRTTIIDSLILFSESVLIDSLLPDSATDRSHIIAVVDTLLYDFNLNWEFYGDLVWRPYEEGRINTHVKIYSVNTFALLDSFPVADYPPGDYPDGDFDVADIVGPYIVYYFFGREGIERYAPAMLFIFDTRTNEATWLRVGWR